jgi:outer membrane usher protein
VFKTAMLALSHTASSFTSLPAAAQFLASLNLLVPRHQAYMNVSLERDSGGSILGLSGSRSNARWRIGTQLSFLVAKALNVSASTSSTAGSASSTLEISKSAPNGPGLGYQVSTTSGTEQSAAAQIDYHTQYGNIEALSNITGSGEAAPTVTVNGSLVGFKQGLFFTQPVTGAYALAKVPGFRDMPIFSGGQFAGRTDGRDAAIVPNLDAYYDNSIGIDQLLDRLDLIVDDSTIKVRPRNMAGVVANFSLRRFHAYTGRIVTSRNGKPIDAVFGTLALKRAGHVVSSDLGSRGQFYVDSVEPGAYEATVTDGDGPCSFHLDLPAGADGVPVTSLGTLTCKVPS